LLCVGRLGIHCIGGGAAVFLRQKFFLRCLLSPFACWQHGIFCLVCGGGCGVRVFVFSRVVCKFFLFFCAFLFFFLRSFSLLFSCRFCIFVVLKDSSFTSFCRCFMLSSSFPFGSRVLRAPSVFSLSAWLVGRGCSSVVFRLSVRSVSGFVAECSFSSFGAARAFSLRAARFVGLFCVVRRSGSVWSVSVPAVLPSGVPAPVGVALAPAAWLGRLSAARRRAVSSVSSPSFS
jgi:hypothetical protein